MKTNRLFRSPYLLAILLLILAGCEGCEDPVKPDNDPPNITSMLADPEEVIQGGTATLTCTATDPDEDALSYIWSSDQGSFPEGDHGAAVSWQAPPTVGECTVTVSVNDGRDVARRSLVITVVEAPPNEPPLPPDNPSPRDGASVASGTEVTMQWSCSDPEGAELTYDVYFGLNPDTTLLQRVAIALDEPMLTLNDLQSEIPYYWRVRAMDGVGGVRNGPVWTFTIEPGVNEPPLAPTSPDPFDEAEQVSLHTLLNWQCQDPNADPLVYDLFLGRTLDLGEDNLVAEGLTSPTYDPDELMVSTPYYWKVRARDDRGGMTDGPVWSFTTAASFITEEEFLLGNSGLSITMVWIEPGSFMMGAQLGEVDARGNEYPRHEVALTQGFWMSKYEVTQDQWTEVAGTSPFEWQNQPNHPAERVTFNAVNEDFLAALNGAQIENPWRLPTEAEWEYACRAGQDETWYPWGSSYAELDAYAWWEDNAGEETHDVGQKQPNAWGLYDMHGNVWEWCSDYYGAYSDEPVTDPQGPSQGTTIVVRGGSYGSPNTMCRSATREPNNPTVHAPGIGFRLVREAGE